MHLYAIPKLNRDCTSGYEGRKFFKEIPLHFRNRKAEFIVTDRGIKLILLNGYTFFKNSHLQDGGSKYSCSSQTSKNCKAYLDVDINNAIIGDPNHNHSPTNFDKIASGCYFGCRMSNFQTRDLEDFIFHHHHLCQLNRNTIYASRRQLMGAQ
ncbi:unnamed protein product [Chilo suppressalis]|uniref:FLYWCH-type domain-containing protein n=1 Tax=Chilo suppressalis TaxID=168631 RepID=A0ABN8AT64_CHISP|nr:unnamed protein product [Chilo suppressalis]